MQWWRPLKTVSALPIVVLSICIAAVGWFCHNRHQPRTLIQRLPVAQGGWLTSVDHLFIDSKQPLTHVQIQALSLAAANVNDEKKEAEVLHTLSCQLLSPDAMIFEAVTAQHHEPRANREQRIEPQCYRQAGWTQ